jgi:membrane protein YdbS with pleckstrin-like domain
MSATPGAPRVMPKYLKATYLADTEFLLEETRATWLFFFPGPTVWLLITGVLALASWVTNLLPNWTTVLVTMAGWFHVSSGTFETYATLFFLFLFFLGLIRFLVRYLRWISTVYAVTNRRVIVQKGILGRDFDQIPVLQVRGVDVHQSFLQRILGYGTVRVSSEGGTRLGNEDWRGIPKPFRFQKLIENAAQGSIANQTPTGPVQWATTPRQ